MALIFQFAVLLVALVVLDTAKAFVEPNLSTSNRTARRLGDRLKKPSLNLNNCETQTGHTGSCMTRFNCMRNGGTVSGFCGTYGVCCETNVQCGKTSKLKRTLIQTPTSIPSKCTYVFEPYSPNVCQIKIEMEEFRLQQPQAVTTGANAGDTVECSDRLEVNDITLCGNNDGQHLYVPFDVAGGTDANVNLIFNLPNRDPVSRWRLIVTQLECPTASTRKGLLPFAKNAGFQDLKNIFSSQSNDLPMLAPRGCTQYFTERTGTFESFNFNSGVGPYMSNLNYAICFQRQVGDSAIEFSFTDFGLPNEGVNNGYDTDCHSLIPTTGRSDDYLLIPGAVVTSTLGTLQPTYFCGTSTKGTKAIYGAAGPFVIYFNSDQYSSPQDLGFQITFNIA
ncbi:uncharacterized protein LOC129907239 [Episyrphus balteatus]|uniref:uncharacterized protein LOC129907239 n=1 Tax=Episyrphus balteatus TaxID=286459 RepID=UPI0024865736|nr:uncharacterized protein LOC129907239 [Episyrphus balteatus]